MTLLALPAPTFAVPSRFCSPFAFCALTGRLWLKQNVWQTPNQMLNNITTRSYNSSPVGSAMGVQVHTEVEVRFFSAC